MIIYITHFDTCIFTDYTAPNVSFCTWWGAPNTFSLLWYVLLRYSWKIGPWSSISIFLQFMPQYPLVGVRGPENVTSDFSPQLTLRLFHQNLRGNSLETWLLSGHNRPCREWGEWNLATTPPPLAWEWTGFPRAVGWQLFPCFARSPGNPYHSACFSYFQLGHCSDKSALLPGRLSLCWLLLYKKDESFKNHSLDPAKHLRGNFARHLYFVGTGFFARVSRFHQKESCRVPLASQVIPVEWRLPRGHFQTPETTLWATAGGECPDFAKGKTASVVTWGSHSCTANPSRPAACFFWSDFFSLNKKCIRNKMVRTNASLLRLCM